MSLWFHPRPNKSGRAPAYTVSGLLPTVTLILTVASFGTAIVISLMTAAFGNIFSRALEQVGWHTDLATIAGMSLALLGLLLRLACDIARRVRKAEGDALLAWDHRGSRMVFLGAWLTLGAVALELLFYVSTPHGPLGF